MTPAGESNVGVARAAPRAALAALLAALLLAPAASFPASPDAASDCAQAVPGTAESLIAQATGLPRLRDGVDGAEAVARACHERFCTAFDDRTRTPLWVAEYLSRDIVRGDNSRPSASWRHDPLLEGNPRIAPVSDDHYRNSGWARGHMAPSADFKCSPDWMAQTFVFSNAVPQWQAGFNSGVWSALEARIQDLAASRGELLAFTGPVHLPPDGSAIEIGADDNACGRRIVLPGRAELKKASICDANDDDPSAACEHGVAVPAGLYKIVYLPSNGRVFAFLIGNHSHTDRKDGRDTGSYLEEWRVSVEVIEELTGIEFLPRLDRRTARVRKEGCAVTQWR